MKQPVLGRLVSYLCYIVPANSFRLNHFDRISEIAYNISPGSFRSFRLELIFTTAS